VLIPGTTTWLEAVPAALVALAVLVLPGAVSLLLLRARPAIALACGPAVSTTVVVVAGSLAAPLGVSWGLLPLLAGTAVAWVLAGLLGAVLRRRVGPSVEEAAAPASRARWWWVPHAATAGGVLAAFAVVARVLTASADTPEEFPQHPDTIFHLGVTQWMAEHGDVSFQHGTTFIDRPLNLGYPTGFHSMAATVSLLTGTSAVVAVSALVLVAAGLVWPFGMAVLTRTTLAPTAAGGAVGAVASVLFVAFPFMLMGFGVLWPNLFGEAMLAGPLAVVVALGVVVARDPVRRPDHRPLLAVLLLSAPGLGLAHPSALVVLILLGGLVLWFAALRRGLSAPAGTARRWWPVTGVSAAIVLATVASVVLSPRSMVDTGAPGPEMSWGDAWTDVVGFAPRVAEPLQLLGVLVAVGVVVIVGWRRRALWAAVAALAFAGLYLANTAIDSEVWRHLTWPWYNNAVRIAAAGVLPAALVAAAAVVGPARAAARRWGPSPWTELGVAALLLGLVIVPVAAGVPRDAHWLRPYFHPGVERSWASPEELAALRELARHIPADAVTAADPWKGGTYLYVVGDRRLYFPTEKSNTTPESRLVGLRLDRVGSDPEVCRIARENHIDYAITGGVPFLWGTDVSARDYVGVNGVGRSPAWREVATAGPYTLYQRVACAT
jgi:hypothetical protein